MFVREAVALLKPGGTLTYSTCTINADENEGMVRYIMDEYPCMQLQPIEVDIGLCGLPGFGLGDKERSYVRRFDPSDTADTMGFFVAKFRKV
jgi:16S rRNA C967 or C1407 C5-methylase (RsmB/RsmF family)